MNKLKVLELFGGIGACSKALEKLEIDYEIADYVEIDKYAVKSFNAIHNTNFEPQDITQWDKDIEVDLVMHGSPCQDFSLAGLQAGGDEGSGTRSSLMYETIRIVKKLKPKYVVWENVKNLLSKKHRHNFDSYLEIMEQLGYQNYYQVLNAKDYGIPQNRERVFTISILERNSLGFAFDISSFQFPPKQELKLKLKDMLEDNVDEKYYLSDKLLKCFMSNGTGKYPRRERFLQNINKENKDVANTIITTEGNKPTCNFIKDTRNMKEQLCDELIEQGKVKEYDVIRHSYSNSRMKEWETRNIEKNNEVPTLDTRCDCLGVVTTTNEPRVLGGIGEKKSNGGTQWYQQDRIYDNNVGLSLSTTAQPYYPDKQLRIRKLTPCECWKLMGFDRSDFEKASKVNSNAQLYKQAGNSIVVNVLMAIFKEMI